MKQTMKLERHYLIVTMQVLRLIRFRGGLDAFMPFTKYEITARIEGDCSFSPLPWSRWRNSGAIKTVRYLQIARTWTLARWNYVTIINPVLLSADELYSVFPVKERRPPPSSGHWLVLGQWLWIIVCTVLGSGSLTGVQCAPVRRCCWEMGVTTQFSFTCMSIPFLMDLIFVFKSYAGQILWYLFLQGFFRWGIIQWRWLHQFLCCYKKKPSFFQTKDFLLNLNFKGKLHKEKSK